VIAAVPTSPPVLADLWWDGGWGIVWGLGTLAFWIAVIAVIVILVPAAARSPQGVGGRSALRVLEERYARGEISRDEFLDRRAVLADSQTQRQA
jgi:putative membrane protein